MNPMTAENRADDADVRAAATRATTLRRALDATRPRRVGRPTATVVLVALAYGAWLVWLSADGYFWGDDWHFLLHRGTVPGEEQGDLMTPFNGHWSILMILTYRTLFAFTGMTTYVPFLTVLVAFHVGICVAMFHLLRRTGAHAWIAATVALTILFTGVAPEMVVFDAAMNHSGSILCGLIAVLALTRADADRRATAAAWLALTLAVMWSSTGISAIIIAAVFATIHWGRRMGLRVATVPTLVFLFWYVGWGRHDRGAQLTWDAIAGAPQYIWTGLTKVFGSAVAIPELGPVVFVVLMINLMTDRDSNPALRHLAWSGVAAATVQLLLEALTRGHMGVEAASTGRYAYFSLVLLAPVLCLAVARLSRLTVDPRWLPAMAVTAALVGYAVHGVNQVRQYSDGYASVSRAWLDRLHGMEASADDGQRMLTSTYDELVNHGLGQDIIASDVVRRALPEGVASAEGRLGAETMFNVGVGTETYDLFNPAFIDLTYGWNRKIKKLPGCATYTAVVDNPMLQIATLDGIEIGVTSGATTVTTRLVRDDVTADGRIWHVPEGAIHIASTAKDALLQVSFNAGGEYTICKQ